VFGFSIRVDANSSPDEAQRMVTKAVTYLKTQGKEKALNEFCNTQGKFRRGELYVFVIDMNANILAHGGKRKMIGKGSFDLTDPDGKFFLKDIVSGAKLRANGWVDYKWTNPMTKKVEQKTTYFQKMDDIILCSGAYKG
jgi:cytochrome c